MGTFIGALIMLAASATTGALSMRSNRLAREEARSLADQEREDFLKENKRKESLDNRALRLGRQSLAHESAMEKERQKMIKEDERTALTEKNIENRQTIAGSFYASPMVTKNPRKDSFLRIR